MKKSMLSLFYTFVVIISFSQWTFAEDVAVQNEPKLIEQTVATQGLDSERFGKLILDNNKSWLNPQPGDIFYVFSMKHVNKDDLWEASVDIVSNTVSLQMDGGEVFNQKLDSRYEPYSSGFPRVITFSQGISFFGPLHEFCFRPDIDQAILVSEDTLNGKDVWIGRIIPLVRAETEKIPESLDNMLRRHATHPAYMYEFTPAVDKDGKVAIEIKCVNSEGPGWAEISALRKENPSQIIWGGKVISAQTRDFMGEKRPVIVIDKDENFTGTSPIRKMLFDTGVNNMTDKLTLGEGSDVLDEALFESLRAEKRKSRLPICVGCGIFRSWYGSSQGRVDIDQIWVEKETGLVLREEGFYNGKCNFVASYEEYEKLNNQFFPKHIVVTLYPIMGMLGMEDVYPWIFDMRFDIYQGKVWLLKELTERGASAKIDAKAEITNVVLKGGN